MSHERRLQPVRQPRTPSTAAPMTEPTPAPSSAQQSGFAAMGERGRSVPGVTSRAARRGVAGNRTTAAGTARVSPVQLRPAPAGDAAAGAPRPHGAAQTAQRPSTPASAPAVPAIPSAGQPSGTESELSQARDAASQTASAAGKPAGQPLTHRFGTHSHLECHPARGESVKSPPPSALPAPGPGLCRLRLREAAGAHAGRNRGPGWRSQRFVRDESLFQPNGRWLLG